MPFEDDPYRDEDGEPLMDYDDFGAGRDPSPEPHQDDGLEDNDDLRDRDQSQTPVYDADPSSLKSKPRKRLIKKSHVGKLPVSSDLVDDDGEDGDEGSGKRLKKEKRHKGEKKGPKFPRRSFSDKAATDGEVKEMWDTIAGGDSEDDQEGVRTFDDDNFIDDTGVHPADRYGSDNERSPSHHPQAEEGEEDDEIKELFKMGKKRKKNEKSPAEIALLVENVMAELEVTAEEDAEFNRQGKPAINKLKKLPLLTEVLSKKQLQQEFLDHGVLTLLKNWLEPLPDGSLPNINIRAAILKILTDFPIDLEQYDRREQLKKSGLGKVIMFLSKSDEETTSNRKLAKELVDKWKLRSIMQDAKPNSNESAPLMAQNDTLRNDGVIPQLFISVPSLNEAASYLSQTTSLFTRCFSDYSDLSSSDSGVSNEHAQELVTFSSGQPWGSFATSGDHASSSGNHSAYAESSSNATDAPSVLDGTLRSSAGDSSQNSSALVKSDPSGPGSISIFQGLVDRVRRTVRGSADDIGWLQRDPTMPPVEDGTERFMEILGDIRHGVHRLPNSMVCLLLPGLFSNHGPLYFVNTKMSLSKMGLACHIAKIHSEASVEKNAREIKEYIEEFYWGSKKRVLLLGHSKGGIDAAAALSLYWPDLKDKVAGLVLAQSPYGGSPIATDILREGQLGDYVNLRKLMEILICKVIKGDLQALEDLTYEKRREFLKKHPLPKELPVVSFHTEAAISPAVLATLSHVAHAELPMVAPLSTGQLAKLPVVIPLGAAMAACAQLLQVRYGKKSDGLVTCCDAEVPGSIVVRPKRKLDHAWMVYSSLTDDPSEADASQVCEALLTLLVEVGKKKSDHTDMEQKKSNHADVGQKKSDHAKDE